ncbi:YqeB family protein [Cytobacillus massiliigabonensis]|uniref:YqeB family protein n=1 Tax=Cytobacillus massiliigabonensis TaxID=1871011 RepID=UPI000C82F876|nr:50S ribosomal protein L29 [Cytobacillus massiliigabonensis]
MNENKTVLGLTKLEKTLVIFVPMIVGGVIGWFMPVIADWLLKLPVVPLEIIIEIIASFNSLWASIVTTIIGIIIGVLLTFIIFNESLEVTISKDDLKLKFGEKVVTIAKKDISAVYLENKQLIILGQHSVELYREVIDAKKDIVREAFQNDQYPWNEKDPFESDYQRWVLGHPDFPEKISAFLYAREHALKENKKKEAKHLREDLAKLGAVIKDDKGAQYVRLAEGAKLGK